MTAAIRPAGRGERQGIRTLGAAALTLAYVLAASATPAFVAATSEGQPFLFTASFVAGMGIALAAYMAFRHAREMDRPSVWGAVWRAIPGRLTAFMVMSQFDLVLFAFAVILLHVPVATALHQLAPLLTIVMLSRLFSRSVRYRRFGWLNVAGSALSVSGAIMVVASHGTVDGLGFWASHMWPLAAGVLLAAGAAVLTALGALAVPWGTSLAGKVADSQPTHRLEVFGVLVGALISIACALPLMTGAGLVLGESMDARQMLVITLGGAFIGGLPAILWYRAVLLTADIGVNSLLLLVPLFSIAWLYLFGMEGQVSLLLLVPGVALIVAGNSGVLLESYAGSFVKGLQWNGDPEAVERADATISGR